MCLVMEEALANAILGKKSATSNLRRHLSDLGYGGHDEDEAQMGGVSALMSIGLFDIMGATQKPVYEITSPILMK